MIFWKNLSAIIVVITTFLFIAFMFTLNIKGLTISLIILVINIIINEFCKTVMKNKIINDEYRQRFSKK